MFLEDGTDHVVIIFIIFKNKILKKLCWIVQKCQRLKWYSLKAIVWQKKWKYFFFIRIIELNSSIPASE